MLAPEDFGLDRVSGVHVVVGGLAAFSMAILRALRYNRSNVFVIVVEAVMCAFFSVSGISALHHWFGLSYSFAEFFGVMIGFLGTDFFRKCLVLFIPSHLPQSMRDELAKTISEHDQRKRRTAKSEEHRDNP